jgi:hypothetical protein
MRRILGYLNGAPQWSDNVPANPGSFPLGGELIVGASGSWENQRKAEREHAARKREMRARRVTT